MCSQPALCGLCLCGPLWVARAEPPAPARPAAAPAPFQGGSSTASTRPARGRAWQVPVQASSAPLLWVLCNRKGHSCPAAWTSHTTVRVSSPECPFSRPNYHPVSCRSPRLAGCLAVSHNPPRQCPAPATLSVTSFLTQLWGTGRSPGNPPVSLGDLIIQPPSQGRHPNST